MHQRKLQVVYSCEIMEGVLSDIGGKIVTLVTLVKYG